MFQCIVHLNKIQKNHLLFSSCRQKRRTECKIEHSIVEKLVVKGQMTKTRKRSFLLKVMVNLLQSPILSSM